MPGIVDQGFIPDWTLVHGSTRLPRSMPNADQNHSIDTDQCKSMPDQFCLISIARNWSALIGIDRHWDQCHNFDRYWSPLGIERGSPGIVYIVWILQTGFAPIYPYAEWAFNCQCLIKPDKICPNLDMHEKSWSRISNPSHPSTRLGELWPLVHWKYPPICGIFDVAHLIWSPIRANFSKCHFWY